jgi:serine/threonine protein kinase
MRPPDTSTTAPVAIYIVTEVLAALAHAHDLLDADGAPLRIVHRDVSPHNVLIARDGEVKLTDFGIAKASTHRSVFYKVRGKVGYMSPEQARGQPATASSDFFSLGCILYEVLTGQRAFARGSAADTVSAILNEQPEFTDASAPWPAKLIPIVQRCLAKQPAHRFQSGRDLAFALRHALTATAGAGPADSIAVLPFANAGGADAEYLSDGIAESLINNLTRIPRLRVVPRSIVFRYSRSDIDPLPSAVIWARACCSLAR